MCIQIQSMNQYVQCNVHTAMNTMEPLKNQEGVNVLVISSTSAGS